MCMLYETERIQRMVTPGRVKTVMGCLLGQFQLCAVMECVCMIVYAWAAIVGVVGHE